MKLTAPLAGAGVGAALALLAGLANGKGAASSASSGSGATLPDAGNGAPSMGTRDPVQDVSTSALPIPAGQRPSPVAAPNAMGGGPDAIMQANIAQEMAAPPQGTQPTASSPISTSDVLTALLGASAAGGAAAMPGEAGINTPVVNGKPQSAVMPNGQPAIAAPEAMKLLPSPVGPQDAREGPHDDAFVGPRDDAAIGPPLNPTKQFSVGGKTYMLDNNGNVLSEGGEVLGKASTMFKGNKAATRALAAIGRTVH